MRRISVYASTVVIICIITACLYFRGFIGFGMDCIIHSHINNIEKYFHLNDLKQSELVDYNVNCMRLNGFQITAVLTFPKERFDEIFIYYKNFVRNTKYMDCVLFNESGISEEKFDFYIWHPAVVGFGKTKTQREIYIIKSVSEDGKCKVYLSIDKVGWIEK